MPSPRSKTGSSFSLACPFSGRKTANATVIIAATSTVRLLVPTLAPLLDSTRSVERLHLKFCKTWRVKRTDRAKLGYIGIGKRYLKDAGAACDKVDPRCGR